MISYNELRHARMDIQRIEDRLMRLTHELTAARACVDRLTGIDADTAKLSLSEASVTTAVIEGYVGDLRGLLGQMESIPSAIVTHVVGGQT